MASYTVSTGKHATLTANVVDVVTFSSDPSQVEVLNRGATGYLWFRTDGIAPTVAGDNTRVVPPGGALTVGIGAADTVRLISDTAVPYSVSGI